MHIHLSCSALALAILPFALSAPCADVQEAQSTAPAAGGLTAAQVLLAAPQSSTCTGAPAAGQCRTNVEAAPLIQNSFDAFNITNTAEKAAVLSIMAFESGDFKYNTPTNPVPGKGTRNMQSAEYNAKYAAQIPDLSNKVAGAHGSPDEIVHLLTANDWYDFGSGAWFLATQCSPAVRAALQKGDIPGWTKYIEIVGTTVTEKRQAGFQTALKALS